MAELPFIDTHVHFYDLQNEDLFYVWLQPGWKHPQLGDIEPIQAQRYWADDWVAESRFANVPKSIHVQAALGIKDPVEETRWLQAFADRLGHPHGIVAEVHLAESDAEAVIERHMEFANMRGVRDFGPGDYLVDPDWQREKRAFRQISGATLANVVDQIEHVCELAGNARHSGIGTDLDGGFGQEQSPRDMNTIADLQKLVPEMQRRGFEDADIRAILSGNWIRFLKEKWDRSSG